RSRIFSAVSRVSGKWNPVSRKNTSMRGSMRQARSTRTASCIEQATAISGKNRSIAQVRMYSADAPSRSGSSPTSAGALGDIEVPPGLQHVDDPSRRLLGRLALGCDLDLRVQRRLVGVVDTGEALERAGARLGIEALHIPVLADLQRGGDVDLEEVVADQFPDLVTHRAVGGDGGGDDLYPIAGEQLGDEADPPDVDVAVLLREAETLGQVLPHDVAIQQLDALASGPEGGHQGLRNGALPGRRQPGHPDHAPAIRPCDRLAGGRSCIKSRWF